MREIIVVRGGGDIATGTIYHLHQCGFRVLILECAGPTAIRRKAAFCEAVYQGTSLVEGVCCRKIENWKACQAVWDAGEIPLLVDETGTSIPEIKPVVVVDAILAKKNLGTCREMAPFTIGLGPGFDAGVDVDVVIETMRGHNLGRIIRKGPAMPDTGVPGLIAGFGKERVVHAPASGVIKTIRQIGDVVEKDEPIAMIGDTPVPATLTGVLRGIIRDGFCVWKGLKIADIDPRSSEQKNCFTISDKSRCIAGGVALAIFHFLAEREEEKDGENEGDRTDAFPPIESLGDGNEKWKEAFEKDERTVYLDHAATTLPKPRCVVEAVEAAMSRMGNSSRGTHGNALTAARMIYDAREAAAQLFHCSPGRVAFTANSTESLNAAIMGLFGPGDHLISTDLEHNSVLRPLYRLEKAGARLSFVEADSRGCINYEDFEKRICPDTKGIICTHASNLTGNKLDLKRIGEIAAKHRLLFVVDASQTAGVFPINMEEMHIDVLCFTGHKSLMGPQGTGGICLREGIDIRPFKVGGSGILTYETEQPAVFPTVLEAGTLNGHGIAGLKAGMEYIREVGMDRIREKETALARRFYEGVSQIPGITVYGDFSHWDRAPIVALNVWDYDSSQVSDELDQVYGIATRPGAHCAPRMHRALGTMDQGAVRFSFSWSNTEEEVDRAIRALHSIALEE